MIIYIYIFEKIYISLLSMTNAMIIEEKINIQTIQFKKIFSFIDFISTSLGDKTVYSFIFHSLFLFSFRLFQQNNYKLGIKFTLQLPRLHPLSPTTPLSSRNGGWRWYFHQLRKSVRKRKQC